MTPCVKDIKDRQVENVGGELKVANGTGTYRRVHIRRDGLLQRPHTLHSRNVFNPDSLWQTGRPTRPYLVGEVRS